MAFWWINIGINVNVIFVEFINILNVRKHIVFVLNLITYQLKYLITLIALCNWQIKKRKQLVEFLVRMFHSYFLYGRCYEYLGVIYLTNSFFQVVPFKGLAWTRLLFYSCCPLVFQFSSVSARVSFAKCRHFVFQSGKATGSDSGGVIDLTMDDEESGASQGTHK